MNPNKADQESLTEYWDSYWTANEEATKSSPAQALRRKLILKALSLPEDAKVLDVGSGQGDFALYLSTVHPRCEILGLELSEAGVAISSRKVPKHTFLTRDLTRPAALPPKYEGWATHAACCEVIEHIERPEDFLAHIRPYLAPGCKFVVTVPGGPMSAFDHHIGHIRHYSPRDLRMLLTEAGFVVERISGVGFPFFNLYRLMVILRGRKLIQDVASPDPASVSFMVKAGSVVFSTLFKLNLPLPWGWQTIAIARVA